MTTLSHAAIGYLIAKAFVDKGMLPPNTVAPYVLSIAFANLPDIDGLVSLRRLYDHHNSLKNYSHYPANWLLVLAFSALLIVPFRLPYAYQYLAIAGLNIFLHFVLDTFSIYHGIAWFGPWKKRKFSFIRLMPMVPSNTHEWVRWYLKHWVIYLEVALWIVSLLVVTGEFRKMGI